MVNHMGYRFRMEERERLEKVRQYLYTHLHEVVRMEALCALAIMSRQKLNAGFQKLYGKPVQRYLMALRMEKARELLLTTEESIGAIAALCGYEHQSNFSKAYKKYHGRLPRSEQKSADAT